MTTLNELEEKAKNLAFNHFHDDPHDPEDFEFNVIVRSADGVTKFFEVSAEADVIFYARETK